jgi:hypothetical protein
MKPIKFLIFLLLVFVLINVLFPSMVVLAALAHSMLNSPPANSWSLTLHVASALLAGLIGLFGATFASTCLVSLFIPSSKTWLGAHLQRLVVKLVETYWNPPGPN